MSNTIGGGLPLIVPGMLQQHARGDLNATGAGDRPRDFDRNIHQAIERFMTELLATLADYLAAGDAQSGIPGGLGLPETRGAASNPSRASKTSSRGKARLGGFLWKPSSDADGKLVILLPPELSAQPSRLRVAGPDGKTIATGKMGGIGNGNRRHFRFDRPGSSFPPGSAVVLELADGRVKKIGIPRPAERQEMRHLR